MHASLLGNREGPGQLPSEKLQAGGRRKEEGGGGNREGKEGWRKGGECCDIHALVIAWLCPTGTQSSYTSHTRSAQDPADKTSAGGSKKS